MRFTYVSVLLGCFVVFSANSLKAAEIMVPKIATSQNAAPFTILGEYVPGDPRYQQAYDSSSFGNSPIVVKEISFVRVISGYMRTGTYNFSFSTIVDDIDSLSASDFDANVGTDPQFFASVELGGIAPPVLAIAGVPFEYDPTKGNLLLDVHIQNVGGLGGFPAHFASTTDAVGEVSRYYSGGFPVMPWLGWGLQTRFTLIPEPTTSFLFLISVIFACSRQLDLHQHQPVYRTSA